MEYLEEGIFPLLYISRKCALRHFSPGFQFTLRGKLSSKGQDHRADTPRGRIRLLKAVYVNTATSPVAQVEVGIGKKQKLKRNQNCNI